MREPPDRQEQLGEGLKDMSGLTILKQRYPQLIAELPEEFDSRDLIALIIERYKHLYEATKSEYPEAKRGEPSFHGQLALGLTEFPDLVEQVGTRKSKTKKGTISETTVWRKRHVGKAS